MIDSERRTLEAVRAALRLGQPVPTEGPDCLSDELVAAMVDGTLDPAGRGSAVNHLAGCAHCRSVLASVSRTVSDPAVTAAIAPPRRRLAWLTLPAAAASILLLLQLGPSADERTTPLHRSPATSTPEQPTAIAPLGEGTRPAWLRWSSIPEADLYRVTLYDSNGQSLYEIELHDTAAAYPIRSASPRGTDISGRSTRGRAGSAGPRLHCSSSRSTEAPDDYPWLAHPRRERLAVFGLGLRAAPGGAHTRVRAGGRASGAADDGEAGGRGCAPAIDPRTRRESSESSVGGAGTRVSLRGGVAGLLPRAGGRAVH